MSRGGARCAAGIRTALAAAAIALAAGCTSQQVYEASQGFRRTECNRIVDADARARCFEQADRDYGSYRGERDAARSR